MHVAQGFLIGAIIGAGMIHSPQTERSAPPTPSGAMCWSVLLAILRSDAETALHGTAGWRLLDPRTASHRTPPSTSGDELELELARARELDDPWIREALTKIGDGYGRCATAGGRRRPGRRPNRTRSNATSRSTPAVSAPVGGSQ
jgi:hypothetical protein